MSFIIYLVIGYAVAVLFPFPYLSQAIIDVWAKFGVWLKSKTTSTTPTDTTK